MSSFLNVGDLINLIPFVPQLKDIFFHWVNLDDNNRRHLKFLAEQNKNIGIKPMILALEQWENMQNNFGAPGVEKEFVIWDNITLQEILECSNTLNKIIIEIMCLT